MKTRPLWIAAIALAWTAAASADYDAGMRRATLANGLAVLLAPDTLASAVDVGVWYAAGPRFERTGKSGITHLFERLMSRGSAQFPAGEHARRLEAVGAAPVSTTNPDFTGFSETVPPDALELALKLEADRMSSLAITQAGVGADLAAARAERKTRLAGGPFGPGLETLYATAFAGHPYARPVIGLDEDLASITLADAQEYYRTRFGPQGALVTVVGRFEPTSALAAVRAAFEAIPSRPRPAQAPIAVPAPAGPRRVVDVVDSPLAILIVGWRAPGLADADAPALDILSHVLTGGSGALLQRVLVGGKQPFLQFNGDFDARHDASLLFCAALVQPGADTAATEIKLVAQIETLGRAPAADDDIERAKRQTEFAARFGLQTSHDRGQTLAAAEFAGGDASEARRWLDALPKVDAADVERAAGRILKPSNRTVVWLLPKRSPPPATGQPRR